MSNVDPVSPKEPSVEDSPELSAALAEEVAPVENASPVFIAPTEPAEVIEPKHAKPAELDLDIVLTKDNFDLWRKMLNGELLHDPETYRWVGLTFYIGYEIRVVQFGEVIAKLA